jgi:hypothetical protein
MDSIRTDQQIALCRAAVAKDGSDPLALLCALSLARFNFLEPLAKFKLDALAHDRLMQNVVQHAALEGDTGQPLAWLQPIGEFSQLFALPIPHHHAWGSNRLCDHRTIKPQRL